MGREGYNFFFCFSGRVDGGSRVVVVVLLFIVVDILFYCSEYIILL